MPKNQETTASGKIAKKGFEEAAAKGADFHVKSIVVNGAKKGASQSDAADLNHKTAMFPPDLKPTLENPNPAPLNSLCLLSIMYMHCALILKLAALYLMMLILLELYCIGCIIPYLSHPEHQLTWIANGTYYNSPMMPCKPTGWLLNWRV
ncbi:hypothetical protein B0H10DRAFT_1953781 [Mycena sp. CBHHK59/15]|nr:hypothetical protein B0H10DRAFT_1953781 [Mycena sp. CBHHK59/15]